MHISIEGLDGVGKTSLAKRIARKLQIPFWEKPVHYLMGMDESGYSAYSKMSDHINGLPDSEKDIRAWFYGLGILYLRRVLGVESFISDRYLGSTYGWNGGHLSERVFDLLVDLAGKPELTILVTCSADERRNRMRKRNPQDPDIIAEMNDADVNMKMEKFYRKHGFAYEVLDTTLMSQEETFVAAMTLLCDYKLI